MAQPTDNPFVTTKPPETPLSVALHPLVLLTASDLITRHHVRQMEGPPVGILLGQQSGQDVTVEHAFPGRVFKAEGGVWQLHQEWTDARIQQFKDVHKAPALDVVGWFTTTSETGPTGEHASIQAQLTQLFSETGLFLAIHPAGIASTDTTNRKLPITIYESVPESESAPGDVTMQVDGDEAPRLKFRELSYTIETDETEMIAIDYVAKGAGSAAAIEPPASSAASKTTSADHKGKQRADGKSEKSAEVVEPSVTLTTEEEDQIAGINTRLNSVKMLQTRLQVISKFVSSLPPSYLSDGTTPLSETTPNAEHVPHLRTVQALLTRLALLTPAQAPDQVSSPAQEAALLQRNDVALTTLLAQLGQDVQGLDELGRKFATVEQGKSNKSKNKSGFGQSVYGGSDEHDGRVGGFNLNSAERLFV